jgi:hypothetical protein
VSRAEGHLRDQSHPRVLDQALGGHNVGVRINQFDSARTSVSVEWCQSPLTHAEGSLARMKT